jgi:hypothetical protein
LRRWWRILRRSFFCLCLRIFLRRFLTTLPNTHLGHDGLTQAGGLARRGREPTSMLHPAQNMHRRSRAPWARADFNASSGTKHAIVGAHARGSVRPHGGEQKSGRIIGIEDLFVNAHHSFVMRARRSPAGKSRLTVERGCVRWSPLFARPRAARRHRSWEEARGGPAREHRDA